MTGTGSRFFAFLGLAVLASGCQIGGPPALSLEEAKQVTASFEDTAFVPPPRTINDITAILDRQPLADPEAARKALENISRAPPVGAGDDALARFYWKRGKAAGKVGMIEQQIADLRKAERFSRTGGWEFRMRVLWDLGSPEWQSGQRTQSLRHKKEALAVIPPDKPGWSLGRRDALAAFYAFNGDLVEAERLLAESERALAVARTWNTWRKEGNLWTSFFERARAVVLQAQGKHRKAELLFRSALAHTEEDLRINPGRSLGPRVIESRRAELAQNLIKQDRLIAAEVFARKALTDVLERVGRTSTGTAVRVNILADIMRGQGRNREAEQLTRAALEILERAGIDRHARRMAKTRHKLARTLANQGEWQAALAEYDIIGKDLHADAKTMGKFFSTNLTRIMALVKTGRAAEAVPIAEGAVQRIGAAKRDKNAIPAKALGILAAARVAAGDRAGALADFARAVPVLMSKSRRSEDEDSLEAGRHKGFEFILEAYMGLLADVRGTDLESRAGIDAAAEAFRAADVLRGQSVQRALSASGARATADNPELADLARREQDAQRQISTLNTLLADVLSQPTDQQNPETVASLRARVDRLGRARAALSAEIEGRFPAYADLIDPKPPTVDGTRALLGPGEALISTYAGEDRTYVWAVPRQGPVAFTAADIGRANLEDQVAVVRASLEPNAQTLGDIPAFDVATAHDLYERLLAPVKAGWAGADSLLVVAHGPLGYLPLSVLPTRPAELAAEEGALFSNHGKVPWLARTHAVTMLPSVASLRTLRDLPPGAESRRAFAGFGDPWFSVAQAAKAFVEQAETVVSSRGVGMRGRAISLRATPDTNGLDSAELAQLPRLPDTADEIESIAVALNADLTRDVFLGRRANEEALKATDLSGYKVLVFATHGLVPGDLNGLTQPALALTAPDVADVGGDGLLTMGEILGLKLDADWVVLSACNTGSGQGAGAEAVSGLGRAFFYAGTRALLVSNWPVETTSAKTLTTDLFRRQAEDASLTRAEALRQAMLALIDGPGYIDAMTGKAVFSYAHPIFWAPFSLIGDGGGASKSP
jgi:CHAT domain-containing protein/tetratricopeptide (TPR) repeat protein